MVFTVLLALISAIPTLLALPLLEGWQGFVEWGEMAADVFDTVGRVLF